MQGEIIVTTREQLQEIITSSLREMLPDFGATQLVKKAAPRGEQLDVDQAVEFLKEKGYPIQKRTIYGLVSKGEIPFTKFGKYLTFTPSELLTWARNKARKGHTAMDARAEAAAIISKNARRRGA